MRFENADEAFDHLNHLLEILPIIQEKDATLFQAHEATELMELARITRGAQRELARIDDVLDKASHDLEQAQTNGDPMESDMKQREFLYWSNQHAYHSSPEQYNKQRYEKALQESPFKDGDEVQAAFLPIVQLKALAEEIWEYRDDYAETLAYCQEHGMNSEHVR